MYVVIFKSLKKENVPNEYQEYFKKLYLKAQTFPGFIKFENWTESNGRSVSLSYWENKEDIQKWQKDELHLLVKQKKWQWYKNYEIEICQVISRKQELNNEI